MHRHSGNFDSLRRNSIINQLLPRFFGGAKVQINVIAGPALPESIGGISYDGDQRNAIEESEFFQHPSKDVLRQRVDADDNVRTPALKKGAHISDAAGMKEFARLRTKTIDGPVEVLHPMLFVAQDPVVEINELCADVMGFFNCAHDTNRVRLALEEILDASDNRRGRRSMATARVGRNN